MIVGTAVPTIISGTTVPTMNAGTNISLEAVPATFVGTAVPTIIVGTTVPTTIAGTNNFFGWLFQLSKPSALTGRNKITYIARLPSLKKSVLPPSPNP